MKAIVAVIVKGSKEKSAIAYESRPISSNVILGSSLTSVNNANYAN